ncbi:MAG TPA: serine protease [Flavobacteriales bacterium]|nr:serine protease [Flavobacteriales bacterium]HPH82987.1 serine protease [Flavobacteriales bacterium]
MKNLIVLIILSLTSSLLFSQTNEELPFSTINFVRTGNYFGSACRSDITLPNQREFNLSHKSIVKYKVYSEGEINITLNVFCPGANGGPSKSQSSQISINVKRGEEYYVLYSKGALEQVQKADVEEYLIKIDNIQKHQENIEFPIIKSSINDIAKKDGKGQGTCFLISSDGYLVTNYHCIENAKEITIKGIGSDYTTKYGVTIVATDPSNDLALLKISNKNLKFSIPPFAIRSSGVAQAEKIYALGFPQTKSMGEELKITEGIISSKSGAQGDISKFQISAAVNPGNSGGPLIDEEGNLVGVIYAKSKVAESAGYAIKASYLETFLKNIDGFEFPNLTNLIKEKPLTEKVEILKDYIFILECN